MWLSTKPSMLCLWPRTEAPQRQKREGKLSGLRQHIFSRGFQQVVFYFFTELLRVQDGGSRGRLTKEKGGGRRPGSCSSQGFAGMGFHRVSGLDVWDNWAKAIVEEEKGANFCKREVRDASHCVHVCQIRPSHFLSLETAPVHWTSPLSIWENCVQMDLKGSENRDPFPMSLSIVWYNCESANGTLSLFFGLSLFPATPLPIVSFFLPSALPIVQVIGPRGAELTA